MAKKIVGGISYELDPVECPYREFRDNELGQELWGLGPAAFRTVALQLQSKTAPKPPTDFIWTDDQTQPLPRSARQYLHGWVRAEELASVRWDAEIAVFDENEGGKMSIRDMQLTHAQVLLRSSFCRRVLSACFMLERCDSLPVEHQWDNFVFSFGPEGWRAKYHIYSPGMKAGGGLQHKPGISKSGCYLVRLFYLGAWRCVWVSDQVPVDANDAPLLPFSPMVTQVPPPPPTKPGFKPPSSMFMSNTVYLWPLLICKALLKLAAPDMTQDDSEIEAVDELMPEFNILHSLTGCMDLIFQVNGKDELWKLITQEVVMFSWDDDDETVASTIKTKSTKKPTNKEYINSRLKSSMVSVLIEDTKTCPPYILPGVTPGHEMNLLVSMARDVPLKRPLPEPEVSPWKYYRWVDWARRHGLYEAYECPRTRFLKVNGLMKLSLAPHLLDVQSTESITYGFRLEHSNTSKTTAPAGIRQKSKIENDPGAAATRIIKEELREWVHFDSIEPLVEEVSVLYFPSMFHFTSAAYHPPPRPVTKAPPNRAIDMPAPKHGPLYLQIDGSDEIKLRLSLNMLHPRVLINSSVPMEEYIEPAYIILEKFDWFEDCELPVAKGFVSTRGYDSVEINFRPGRHFCRLWVHSRIGWHVMLLSESDLLMGTRDVIQAAAIHECPWASKFLTSLSSAFVNWIRVNRSNQNILEIDREFFRSYQPDLAWDPEQVGYNQALLHWMFRQALQSVLSKRLGEVEYRSVTHVLRHYLCDPDFGLPPKPNPPKSFREIIAADICDCAMPETEEIEIVEEQVEEQQIIEERALISPSKMKQLLTSTGAPMISHVCELASEEIPCGVLKIERDKLLRKHEAATCIQAYWRGTWARKCLNSHIAYTPDVLKLIMDNAFGNMDALSSLMNEFFGMYPGAKKAYSVASALGGVYGLHQHSGTSPVTPICRWVPYFQVVFYCHVPVKVHFDIQANLPNSTVAIYNNDTNQPLPQVYNAHITFDIVPNTYGYTVMGHGTLKQRPGYAFDVHWMLTILTSIDGAFHVCDNDPDDCHDLPFQPAYKLHIDEIFLPNRRNILGGILVSVTKHECISFKATATSPDLEMAATLKITSPEGDGPEIMRCEGKGEIYWPYIRLLPSPPGELSPSLSTGLKKRSHASQGALSGISSARSLKQQKLPKNSPGKQNKSMTRLNKEPKVPPPAEARQYSIEVTVPSGWPLSLQQWKRVDEVRNGITAIKVEAPPKKLIRPASTRQTERNAIPAPIPVYQPQPDDAYVELECSIGASANAIARRDDTRDLRFATARKMWEIQEPGRNLRGEQIRAEFREEFLEVPAAPPSESIVVEEALEETEEKKYDERSLQHGPSPATESGLLEMSMESEEEAKYLSMPDQIRDKFIPLYFLPLCMKEKNDEESALLSNDMAEAAKRNRHMRIEAAAERMKELQQFNEWSVIERQRKRCQLLEKLFVDAQYCDELIEKIEERDDAIALETLNRTISASKKKAEQKQDKKK